MRLTRLARRATALTALLLGAAAVVVGPATSASAADACTTRTTTKAFSAFGDTNDYFSITGGTFEAGDLSPFAITGRPTIAAENEPWHAVGANHKRSLALPPGASLTATFCVQLGEDAMRLFIKSPNGTGSSLTLKATVASPTGSASAGASLSGSTSAWMPTPRIPLPNVTGGKQTITFAVTNNGTGTWLLDDVLVDPWRTT